MSTLLLFSLFVASVGVAVGAYVCFKRSPSDAKRPFRDGETPSQVNLQIKNWMQKAREDKVAKIHQSWSRRTESYRDRLGA